jgi:hypothetical protein
VRSLTAAKYIAASRKRSSAATCSRPCRQSSPPTPSPGRSVSKGSAALLAGRLFDDRGNRMSPTHANKKGVRYRYYVSQALLQNRKAEAGSIARVPAPEVESVACDGVRRQLAAAGRTGPASSFTDRELIERHVARVIVTPQALKVCFNPASGAAPQLGDPTLNNPAARNALTLPWTAPSFVGERHHSSASRASRLSGFIAGFSLGWPIVIRVKGGPPLVND